MQCLQQHPKASNLLSKVTFPRSHNSLCWLAAVGHKKGRAADAWNMRCSSVQKRKESGQLNLSLPVTHSVGQSLESSGKQLPWQFVSFQHLSMCMALWARPKKSVRILTSLLVAKSISCGAFLSLQTPSCCDRTMSHSVVKYFSFEEEMAFCRCKSHRNQFK